MRQPEHAGALRALAVVMVSSCLVLSAAQGEEDQSSKPEEPLTTGQVVEIEVLADRVAPDAQEVGAEELQAGQHANLASLLCELSGISGVQRALGAVEPVIRGLGWERVQTQINGVSVHGACPGRMDPPASNVTSAVISRAVVVKGLVSLAAGPPGSGGRIEVSTDYDRGAHPGRELHSWSAIGVGSAGAAWHGDVGIEGGSDRVDFRVGGGRRIQHDYRAADGTHVPADAAGTEAFAVLGWRAGESSRVALSLIGREAGKTDYPALPMNSVETSDRLLSASLELRDPHRGVVAFGLRAGLSRVDHRMDNRGKANRGFLHAQTPSMAQTLSVGAFAELGVRSSLLRLGADFTGLTRDALRTRTIVASGRTFHDHLWPDLRQDVLGVFAQWKRAPRPRLHLRTGLRVDLVSSEARSADDPSLGGASIREHWRAFYGDGAADAAREQTLFSANLQLESQASDEVTVHAGVGLTRRPANLTERYYAFAPAPGGYLVGNPSLDAEVKREIVAGLSWRHLGTELALSLYYDDFRNYIYSTTLTRRDVNGDDVVDRIRGFENLPATLYGGEIDMGWHPSQQWHLRASAAWVHGENDRDRRPLPEIPALELRTSLRRRFGLDEASWCELEARFVDRQERIDELWSENATPGYAVWRLRAHFSLTKLLSLDLSVENLLDKLYHEHLSREVLLPEGGLRSGSEVPQPGRFLHASLRYAK